MTATQLFETMLLNGHEAPRFRRPLQLVSQILKSNKNNVTRKTVQTRQPAPKGHTRALVEFRYVVSGLLETLDFQYEMQNCSL